MLVLILIPDLIPDVFGQVAAMLPKFTSFASIVNWLLQRLILNFWMAAARLQTERATISTQCTTLEELLRELGGERDDY